MARRDTVGVGLVGSQFITTIHAEALRSVPQAEVLAVMSPTTGHARDFASKHGIAHHFEDLDAMLAMDEIDMVVVGAPNFAHCEITVKAAKAGKHVVVEKPLCLNLADADRMIAACDQAGVKLMYAEELCFTPKYVRLKQLLDDGVLGRPVLFKQSEKHDGPHAAHFWDVDRSGGGVTMDMGCHAIQFFRWLNANNPVKSVYAQMNTSVHAARTRGEDNAIIILEFDNGVVALAEESWTKLGGMDDRAEIHGSEGVAYADCAAREFHPDLQREGRGLRRGEGRKHGRVEFRDVRGDLELRLSAGVPAFRRLRAARPPTVGDGSRRQGGPRDPVRCVRVRRLGPQNPAAVFDESGQALRSVAEALGATEHTNAAWPQSITAAIMRR